MPRGENFEKWPLEVRDAIRDKWLKGTIVSELAREYTVGESTIWYWIKRHGWRQAKEEALIQARQDIFDELRKRYSGIANLAIPAIHNSLVERLKNIVKNPLTIAEIKQLSDVVWQWYGQLRIHEGLPTEIVQNNQSVLTTEEMIRIIKKDKFFNSEVIDVKSTDVQRENGEDIRVSISSPTMPGSDIGGGDTRTTDRGNGEGNDSGALGDSVAGHPDRGLESAASDNANGGAKDSGGETSPVGSSPAITEDPFK